MIELKTCDIGTDEQETTISYGRRDDRASVYTNDSTVLTKIAKLLNTEGTQWKLEKIHKDKNGEPSGYFFSCPKKLVKMIAKNKTVTEEQRAALKERMANYRASINGDAKDEEDND